MENTTLRNNPLRLGHFTSSKIVALMSNGKAKDTFGKPFYTYLKSRQREIKLGLPMEVETNTRPLTWGKLAEKRAFNLLGFEYSLSSQETIEHPELKYWSDTSDGLKFKDTSDKTVVEIKCPQTRNSFCDLVECTSIDEVRENHEDGEKFYWQCVSHGVLHDTNKVELIVYMPYKEELQAIKDMIHNPAYISDKEAKHYYWIDSADEEELPYILNNGKYKNLNIIRFEIPQGDKDALIQRVTIASEMLNKAV